jgi:predicted branched-subunit amino acid permease
MHAPAASQPGGETPHSTRHWFGVGLRHALSLPALILASSFVGFAALAMQAGLPLSHTLFMSAFVWALPANVVLIGAILAGTSLPAAFLLITLSSVRLMPMVVALIPEVRTPQTRKWVLYLLSHFVAVTSWVVALQNVRDIPAPMRTAYFFGLSITLLAINLVVVVVVYSFAGDLPPIASAALLLMTPLYFLTSLWGSARERASHVAMVLGLVIGPLIHLVWPNASLLAAGIIGGGLAYAWHRLKGRGSWPR